MKKATLITAAVLSLTLASTSAFADDIRVGGGGASVATVFAPIKAPFDKATGHNLVNLSSTPKNGLIDLVNGKIDAAVAAVPLEGMISGAQKDGVKVDAAALQSTEVAKNKTVVFVNKDNSVSKLSKEQIKGIFTGKITNWKQVGGKDADIIVVWGKNTPGQNGLFIKQVFDGEPVIKEVLDAGDYASIRQAVSANPESIGIDPLSFATDEFKPVTMDIDVSSPVILVTVGKPSAKVQQLLNFIKSDGQKYIKQ